MILKWGWHWQGAELDNVMAFAENTRRIWIEEVPNYICIYVFTQYA